MLGQRRDEKPAMDLRRLCCAGLCACGAALVVLGVPSLRFMLASQVGLAIGWRIAAMPPSILAAAGCSSKEEGAAAGAMLRQLSARLPARLRGGKAKEPPS